MWCSSSVSNASENQEINVVPKIDGVKPLANSQKGHLGPPLTGVVFLSPFAQF